MMDTDTVYTIYAHRKRDKYMTWTPLTHLRPRSEDDCKNLIEALSHAMPSNDYRWDAVKDIPF